MWSFGILNGANIILGEFKSWIWIEHMHDLGPLGVGSALVLASAQEPAPHLRICKQVGGVLCVQSSVWLFRVSVIKVAYEREIEHFSSVC